MFNLSFQLSYWKEGQFNYKIYSHNYQIGLAVLKEAQLVFSYLILYKWFSKKWLPVMIALFFASESIWLFLRNFYYCYD